MDWLISAAFLGLLAACGYALLSILVGKQRRHWAEVAGLSFAGGFGGLGLLLFVVSLCGAVPARTTLAVFAVFVAGALVLLRRGDLLVVPALPVNGSPRWNGRRILGAAAALLIVATALNVAVESLTPGLADVDAYAIWILKAKIISAQALRPIPPALRQPALSYSHQDYPLNFPLIVAGMWAAVGRMDERLGKVVLLPVYLSLIGVVFGNLRTMLRRADALCVTAVFVAAPVLTQHAAMAVAEIPFLLLHTCSLTLLLSWMTRRQRGDLIACFVFAAFAAFTKNEGLALLPMIVVTALLGVTLLPRRRESFGHWLVALLTAALLISPWLLYRAGLPRTHEDYGRKLASLETISRNIPRLGRVLPEFLRLLVQLNTVGAIWLLLALAAIVGWRAFKQKPAIVLWGLLLAHIALYSATFVVTPWDLDVLIPMVGAKLLMHASPTAALLIGLHLQTHVITPVGLAANSSNWTPS